MMRSIFAAMCLAVLTLGANAQVLPGCGKTLIVFGNGVQGDWQKTDEAKAILMDRLKKRVSTADYNKLRFGEAFNPSDGVVGDLIETARFYANTETSAWQYVLRILRRPPNLDALMLTTTVDAVDVALGVVFDTDQKTQALIDAHAQKYRDWIDRGYTVVVIAHSEGNYFANAALSKLEAPYLPAIGMVSAASPDDHVKSAYAKDPHARINGDLVIGGASWFRTTIKNLPESLDVNADWPYEGLEVSSPTVDPWRHGFVDAYMIEDGDAESIIMDHAVHFISTLVNSKCGAPPNQSPIASFTGSVGSTSTFTVTPGQEIVFDPGASYDPDGTINSFEWDFGNGVGLTATSAPVPYSYPAPGLYPVRLKVTDNGNPPLTAEVNHVVTVTNLPYPSDAGVVVIDVPVENFYCVDSSAVVLRQGTKYVVVALTGNGTDFGHLLMRFTEEGIVDLSFGVQGIARISQAVPALSQLRGALCVGAVQSDEKILLSGYTHGAVDNLLRPTVIRLFADGSGLDPMFGTNGVFQLRQEAYGIAGAPVAGMATDGQGRIVIAGSASPAGLAFRLTTAGALDQSFNGGAGIFTWRDHPIYGPLGAIASFNSVLIDGQNRILFGGCGGRCGAYASDGLVMRLSEAGTLDMSFGGSGITWLPLFSGVDPTQSRPGNRAITRLSFDPSGRILATGFNSYNGNGGVIYRLGSNGGIDPAFDYGGVPADRFGNVPTCVGAPVGHGVANGKISLVGSCSDYVDDYVTVARLNDNGSGDAGFNTASLTYPSDAMARRWSLRLGGLNCIGDGPGNGFVQLDGKVLVGGVFGCGNPRLYRGIYFVRFNPDGSVDATFGRQ